MDNSWQFVLNTCAASELVVELDFLGALAHGGKVLIVRRVCRARDADGFNLLRDLHNDMGLLVI